MPHSANINISKNINETKTKHLRFIHIHFWKSMQMVWIKFIIYLSHFFYLASVNTKDKRSMSRLPKSCILTDHLFLLCLVPSPSKILARWFRIWREVLLNVIVGGIFNYNIWNVQITFLWTFAGEILWQHILVLKCKLEAHTNNTEHMAQNLTHRHTDAHQTPKYQKYIYNLTV